MSKPNPIDASVHPVPQPPPPERPELWGVVWQMTSKSWVIDGRTFFSQTDAEDYASSFDSLCYAPGRVRASVFRIPPTTPALTATETVVVGNDWLRCEFTRDGCEVQMRVLEQAARGWSWPKGVICRVGSGVRPELFTYGGVWVRGDSPSDDDMVAALALSTPANAAAYMARCVEAVRQCAEERGGE